MAWDIGADEYTSGDTVLTVSSCAITSIADLVYLNESTPRTFDIGADQYAGSNITLAVAACAFAHASSAVSLSPSGGATLTVQAAALGLSCDAPAIDPGPWSVDFSGIAQQILYKFEVWFGGAWVDVTSLSSTNYLKSMSIKLGGAGMSPDPIAGTWSATIANDSGIFHPVHPTSAYKTLFQIGRKVRISVGRMHNGVPYYWPRLIGYMDAPRYSHGSRTVSLSGCDYSKSLTDTVLRHPGNYFGALATFDSVSSSGVTGAELYDLADAFAVTAIETNSIAAGWTSGESNVVVSSATDSGGGSLYVGKIIRGAATGAAYVHAADIGTVTAGTIYQISFDSKYAVGTSYCTAQLFQTVDGYLRALGAKKTLSFYGYEETLFQFTAIKTGALEIRFSFSPTSVENDELRVDALTVKKHDPTWFRYELPMTNNNGPYFVTLDGVPCCSGADSDPGQAIVPISWHYDENLRYFYFDQSCTINDGTANLLIYYYTDQTPEGVIASLLATAGLYATATAALAAMDYTATGIVLRRVFFEAGASALDAVRVVCERCNYRFWFDAGGVPHFKPAPVVGDIAFDFEKFGDLRDLSDFNDLNEIKNRVTIEGAEQDIFNVNAQRTSSRLKGEAADATSIAAYLEKTSAITNQLFEDQDSIDAMCAVLLAAAKDPKLYAELQLFANAVPLEVGDTIRWRVIF